MDLMLLLLPLVAILAFLVGYLGHKTSTMRTIGDAESRARRIVEDAKRGVEQTARDTEARVRDAEGKVRAAELEAKETALKMRAELEQEGRNRRREIQEVERRIHQQEEQL